MPVVVTIGGVAPNTEQAAALRAAMGIPEPTTISEIKTTLVGTDKVLGIDSEDDDASVFFSLSGIAAYVGGAPSATAPAAMTIGQWTLTAIAGGLRFGITELPDDGGSAITALQYSTDDGATWLPLGGTTTGNYNITGLSEIAYSCKVRAVNAVDADPENDSDTKIETPDASGGGDMSIVQAPAPALQGFGEVVERSLTAVTDGNPLAICVGSTSSSGEPTITDSEGGTWPAALFTHAGAGGKTLRVYSRPAADGVTWVRATFGVAIAGFLGAAEVNLPGGSLVLDDSDNATQTGSTSYLFPFTSTEDNGLFMGAAFLDNDGGTFDGEGDIMAYGFDDDFGFYAVGTVATAGTQDEEVTLSLDPPGEKAWVVLKAGA